MKIKILLMPLMIVLIVALSIWLVYPVYSNGVDGVKENYAKLKKEQVKLIELQNKNENVNNLSRQFSSLSQKSVLYDFVPENTKEEEVINSLNSLSMNSGLLLFDATINQSIKKKIVEEANGIEEAKSVLPETQKIKVEMKLAGSYEKIKDFLNNMAKFNRNNSFDTLEIRNDVTIDAESVSPSVLSVTASADFNILKKTKLDEKNIGSSIFASSELETKVISDITAQKNNNNFQLIVEQKGKSNLFQ